MQITAVIPIRAGSKGLPGKNTRELLGIPLYMHAVRCAKEAGIDEVVVATDDPKVLEHSDPSYKTFHRSAHSARDDAPTHEVLIELIEARNLHENLIVLLQATSPLRRSQTVRAVIDLMNEPDVDLGCSVTRIDNGFLKSGLVKDGFLQPLIDPTTLFKPRQYLPELFKMDGGVYAFHGRWLVDNGSLETDKIKVVKSNHCEALDIDSLDDFALAEKQLRSKVSG